MNEHRRSNAVEDIRTRRRASAIALTLLAISAGCSSGLLSEAAGSTSQMLCGKTFVSGISTERAWEEQQSREPGLNLIAWSVRYHVDRSRREVTASVAGYERRAVYREGRGCTLLYDERGEPESIAITRGPLGLLDFAPEEPAEPTNPALRAALDHAFEEPEGGERATKAVVIAHRGRVIGERYAPGFHKDTPLLGHSAAKSVVNALIGTLVRSGRLTVDQPAPVAIYRQADDARAEVTIDQLLRMNAGFDFDDGGGPSIASTMWFTKPDTADFAERAELEDAPGTTWRYSSRSYVVWDLLVHERYGCARS